jgi:hypothetical protein
MWFTWRRMYKYVDFANITPHHSNVTQMPSHRCRYVHCYRHIAVTNYFTHPFIIIQCDHSNYLISVSLDSNLNHQSSPRIAPRPSTATLQQRLAAAVGQPALHILPTHLGHCYLHHLALYHLHHLISANNTSDNFPRTDCDDITIAQLPLRGA